MTIHVYTVTLADGTSETLLRCERHAPHPGDLWMDPDTEVMTVHRIAPNVRPGTVLGCHICNLSQNATAGRAANTQVADFIRRNSRP